MIKITTEKIWRWLYFPWCFIFISIYS